MTRTLKTTTAATMPMDYARNPSVAYRNKRIRRAYTRKRNPPTQVELAEKFKMTQGRISQILRNPNSELVEPE